MKSIRAELRLEPLADVTRLPRKEEDVPALFKRWGLHLEPQECIWVVAYDVDMTVRTVVEVARGTPVSVSLHLPSLLTAVLVAGCDRFVIVHNHPNGYARPTRADVDLTEAVMEAANACGLWFEDHIILASSGAAYSFTQSGRMKPAKYPSAKAATR